MDHPYARLVAASERVEWALDDVLPPGSELDFDRLFLPDALVDTDHAFLAPRSGGHSITSRGTRT